MRFQRFASAFRRRLKVGSFSPQALAAMAWSPSYRAPSAADLRDELAAQPPNADAPLEQWGAKDIEERDGVIGLSMSGRAFLSAGELFAKRNIRRVRLVAVQPFIAELAACPHLAKLERLNLAGAHLGVRGVRLLAESRFVRGLKELGLSGNSLDEYDAEWFPHLRVLELANNRLSSLRLANLPLESLDAAGNPLGDVDLPSSLKRLNIAECPRWKLTPHLSDLNIGFNDLGDGDLESLAELPLEVLDLSGNRITAAGTAFIGATFESLRELNLTANLIGDDGTLSLMQCESMASLRRLNLSNCGLTDAGVQRLAESGTLGGLESLSLGWNRIGDEAARAIAACPDLAGLRELDLSGTQLGFAGAVALADSGTLGRLDRLVLHENHRLPADAFELPPVLLRFVRGSVGPELEHQQIRLGQNDSSSALQGSS